jgi:HK97 family phage prohead protease
MEKELRVYNNDVEIRLDADGVEHIRGYAVVFNSESRDLGGFIETISPTAFREADMSDVLGLYNHDYNIVLGRTPMTLTLNVDERGVSYDIIPPDTTAAKDLITSIKRGDVRGSSFGFTIAKDGDQWEKPKERGGLYRRTINAVAKLFDVSPVVQPAYVNTDTTIAKRTLGILKDKEEMEVSKKMQDADEIHQLKMQRQRNMIDVDLTYHAGFERKFESQEKEKAQRKEQQRRRIARDLNIHKNLEENKNE